MNKLLTLVFVTFFSSNLFAQQATDNVQGDIYTNTQLGWTIKIPAGYSIISKEQRAADINRTISKLHGHADPTSTSLLLSFKINSAATEPKFLSGLQDRNIPGAYIHTANDLINYATSLIKKSGMGVNVTLFKKKIGAKEFAGYQYIFPNKLIQRGLVLIVGKQAFYQTWVFDNEADAKTIEDVVYTATFSR